MWYWYYNNELISYKWGGKIAGIAPESKSTTTEQGENMEQEQKSVKEALLCAYEKNISTPLKAELFNVEINKDASSSRDIVLF